MSDGTYRDDHEAAVARAGALDRELDRVRAERDAARAERDLLRDRLARARFEPMPPLPMRRGRAASPASLAGGVSLLTVGLIAAAVATSRMETPTPRAVPVPIDVPPPPSAVPAVVHVVPELDLNTCIQMSRELTTGRELDDGGNAAICAAILDGAAFDGRRLPPLARQQVQATADALHALELAVDHERYQHTAEAAFAASRAVDDARDAAERVDMGALHAHH